MNDTAAGGHSRGKHRRTKPLSVYALAGVVLAAFGLIAGWLLFGVPSAVATGLSLKAVRDIDSGKSSGRAIALTGFGLGILGFVIGILTLVAVIAA